MIEDLFARIDLEDTKDHDNVSFIEVAAEEGILMRSEDSNMAFHEVIIEEASSSTYLYPHNMEVTSATCKCEELTSKVLQLEEIAESLLNAVVKLSARVDELEAADNSEPVKMLRHLK